MFDIITNWTVSGSLGSVQGIYTVHFFVFKPLGVEITNVIGNVVSDPPLNSDTNNNNLVFDVTVSSNPNGASISGSNLWEVFVFSDTQVEQQCVIK